jgi:hypothetical protein
MSIDRESVILLLEEARDQAALAETARVDKVITVESLMRSTWHLAAAVRRLSEAVSSLLPPADPNGSPP